MGKKTDNKTATDSSKSKTAELAIVPLDRHMILAPIDAKKAYCSYWDIILRREEQRRKEEAKEEARRCREASLHQERLKEFAEEATRRKNNIDKEIFWATNERKPLDEQFLKQKIADRHNTITIVFGILRDKATLGPTPLKQYIRKLLRQFDISEPSPWPSWYSAIEHYFYQKAHVYTIDQSKYSGLKSYLVPGVFHCTPVAVERVMDSKGEGKEYFGSRIRNTLIWYDLLCDCIAHPERHMGYLSASPSHSYGIADNRNFRDLEDLEKKLEWNIGQILGHESAEGWLSKVRQEPDEYAWKLNMGRIKLTAGIAASVLLIFMLVCCVF